MNNRLMKTEEEARQRVKELLQLPPEDLITQYMFQEQEIERLNNIIDKAIEYIDWQRRNPQYDNVWRNAECEDLIEILRGDKE